MSEKLFYHENIEDSVKVEFPDVDRARSYTYGVFVGVILLDNNLLIG